MYLRDKLDKQEVDLTVLNSIVKQLQNKNPEALNK
jgi:hypothetical protein